MRGDVMSVSKRVEYKCLSCGKVFTKLEDFNKHRESGRCGSG